VSYDCPTGPSEFIENEISGLLVEHNNKKELASKIEDLILDPEKRDFLSKNAEEKIKEFSVENIIKKWEKQFNEII
jgi:GalNAc-alpha-(1->4)-GalNAc-alpha-(1->3)-diNAcBac-PP-undecaprenol alpha-1,4-N-acetyl-D-galactosaminyltransferase